MKKRHLTTSHHHEDRWYRSTPFILVLLMVALVTWFALSFSAAMELDIQPTHITLRSESCAYLRARGVKTMPVKPYNLCSAVVPFRENAFVGGGIIRIGDGEMRVAEDQIIEVGATVDQPWTHEQTRLVILACISTIVMLGLFAWMLINDA